MPHPAIFFGAGGAKMSAAGVELAFDLTQHSVIGISDVLKNISSSGGCSINCSRWRLNASRT